MDDRPDDGSRSEPTSDAGDRCAGITAKGKRCSHTLGLKPFNDGKWYCIGHHPDRRDWRRATASKAGKARGKQLKTVAAWNVPDEIKSGHDAARWSSWCAHQVAVGAMDPQVAREVRGSVQTFLRAYEVAGLEDQVRELQAKVKELKDRAGA
jgi:hypothetical protein